MQTRHDPFEQMRECGRQIEPRCPAAQLEENALLECIVRQLKGRHDFCGNGTQSRQSGKERRGEGGDGERVRRDVAHAVVEGVGDEPAAATRIEIDARRTGKQRCTGSTVFEAAAAAANYNV